MPLDSSKKKDDLCALFYINGTTMKGLSQGGAVKIEIHVPLCYLNIVTTIQLI